MAFVAATCAIVFRVGMAGDNVQPFRVRTDCRSGKNEPEIVSRPETVLVRFTIRTYWLP
jgi:hypothetical protein